MSPSVFNPFLCCLSPFHLFYVAVSRPCCSSEFYPNRALIILFTSSLTAGSLVTLVNLTRKEFPEISINNSYVIQILGQYNLFQYHVIVSFDYIDILGVSFYFSVW